jgi:hypothetical protein
MRNLRLGTFTTQRQHGQRLRTDRCQDLQHVWRRGMRPALSANTVNRTSGTACARMYSTNLRRCRELVVLHAPAVAHAAEISSVRTIVAAARATSVPERPIAKPVSARCSAGVVDAVGVIATSSPFSRDAAMRS